MIQPCGFRFDYIEIIIIIVVVNLVIKFFKKHLRNETPMPERPQDREEVSDKRVIIKTLNQPVNGEQTSYDANLRLKRCPGCGGEIPTSMMKCDLCGRRQHGCGLWVLLIVIVFMLIYLTVNFL